LYLAYLINFKNKYLKIEFFINHYLKRSARAWFFVYELKNLSKFGNGIRDDILELIKQFQIEGTRRI